MPHVLKFRYFFLLLFLVHCKEAPKSEEGSLSNENEEASEPVATISTNKVMLFFGDSLTAGYGIELEEAFPALIQERLDSLGLDYTVVNSGLSGETTSGGLNRINWVLNQKVDVFILELGANDGLRGIPLDQTRNNLQAIIDQVKTKTPKPKLCWPVCRFLQIWVPNIRENSAKYFQNWHRKMKFH